MKQPHHNQSMFPYRDTLMTSSRRRRGGYSILSYRDRSAEVRAINAHLRASRYPEQEKTRSATRPHLTKKAKAHARKRLHPFLRLGQQYDIQARNNFVREAVVLLLLAAVSVWPIIHSVGVIIARW